MVPGIGGPFDFAGGQGNTFGGAAGPATATGGNQTFGNIVSGAGAGYNPFAPATTTGQLMQPVNLFLIGVAVVGVAWVIRKKK